MSTSSMRFLFVRLGLAVVLIALAAVTSLARANALDIAQLSGGWYQPLQSGHGLTVEAIDNERVIVLWYVYDPTGQPVHLYIDGRVDPRSTASVRITGPAYLSRGMRFGEFDPARHTLNAWGQVTITLFDCLEGKLEYVADGIAGAGYGSGSIDLKRLSKTATQILGQSGCTRAVPGFGGVLYSGEYRQRGVNGAQPVFGAADPDGVLWLAGGESPSLFPLSSLSPVIEARVSTILFTRDVSLFVSARDSSVERAPSFWSIAHWSAGDDEVRGLHLDFTENPDLLSRLDVEPRFDTRTPLRRPLDFAQLATVQFTRDILFMNDPPLIRTARIEADGTICVSGPFSADCDLVGKARETHAGWSFFEFELRSVADPLLAPIRGRGWYYVPTTGTATPTLTLIGTRDGVGFAFEGYQQPRR